MAAVSDSGFRPTNHSPSTTPAVGNTETLSFDAKPKTEFTPLEKCSPDIRKQASEVIDKFGDAIGKPRTVSVKTHADGTLTIKVSFTGNHPSPANNVKKLRDCLSTLTDFGYVGAVNPQSQNHDHVEFKLTANFSAIKQKEIEQFSKLASHKHNIEQILGIGVTDENKATLETKLKEYKGILEKIIQIKPADAAFQKVCDSYAKTYHAGSAALMPPAPAQAASNTPPAQPVPTTPATTSPGTPNTTAGTPNTPASAGFDAAPARSRFAYEIDEEGNELSLPTSSDFAGPEAPRAPMSNQGGIASPRVEAID